jgi:hypothetical protein
VSGPDGVPKEVECKVKDIVAWSCSERVRRGEVADGWENANADDMDGSGE